jgi:hypothetical protein
MAMAAEYFEAKLVPSGDPLWRRAGRFVGRLAGGLLGGDVGTDDVDLVILRAGTSIEVHRTRADTGDPELLLAEVQKDLARLTVDEFRAEWSLP